MPTFTVVSRTDNLVGQLWFWTDANWYWSWIRLVIGSHKQTAHAGKKWITSITACTRQLGCFLRSSWAAFFIFARLWTTAFHHPRTFHFIIPVMNDKYRGYSGYQKQSQQYKRSRFHFIIKIEIIASKWKDLVWIVSQKITDYQLAQFLRHVLHTKTS